MVYYGVSGHGKGLVDAMSSFGAKGPLRKAIVQKDFFFNSASDIQNYLLNELADIPNTHYFEVDREKLDERRVSDTEQLPIKHCIKQHMFAYFPDGSIQVKENVYMQALY